jgi:hypothetical protein
VRTELLKLVFRYESLDALEIIERIRAVLNKHGIPVADFSLYDEPLDISAISTRLRRNKRKLFDISGQGFEFNFGAVGNCHLDFLLIKSTGKWKITWDEWLKCVIIDETKFIMAWLVDFEYDYWQNAEDLLQYTSVGKSYSHLPLKSNGLPYPLEQQIIDTSANAGRWLFHDGYVEAVGAVMWTSERFWELTGVKKDEVINANWINVSAFTPSIMRLQVAEQCFTTAKGASGKLQDRLRSLLFSTN